MSQLANRPNEEERPIWARLGNCRKSALLDAFERAWPEIDDALASGERTVELI